MTAKHTSTITVRHYECDAFGTVTAANMARTLQEVAMRRGWAAPARPGIPAPPGIGPTTMPGSFSIRRAADDALIAAAQMVIAWVGRVSGAARPLPPTDAGKVTP